LVIVMLGVVVPELWATKGLSAAAAVALATGDIDTTTAAARATLLTAGAFNGGVVALVNRAKAVRE